MTDPELARETAEKIYGVKAVMPDSVAIVEHMSALILAAFARTADARRATELQSRLSDFVSKDIRYDGADIVIPCTSHWAAMELVRLARIDADMGVTLGGDDNAPSGTVPRRTHGDVTPAIPSEPASRAVPITSGTEPQYPCWVHHQESGWHHFSQGGITTGDWDRLGWTHYHPDQPTAPTCRPTEGGA